MEFILSIDQSTQGTKAVLFDEKGRMVIRRDVPHQQIINEKGWVSHNPLEIYKNVIKSVRQAINDSEIDPSLIKGVGICNQRETTVIWDEDGKPFTDAIVWQCNRAAEVADKLKFHKNLIYRKTGLPLSPYFPAAKIKWLIENIDVSENYKVGTIDTWLIYKLTEGRSYYTDYSNASRTQLLDLKSATWDLEICKIFGIKIDNLPEILDSDACFGVTDFEGLLEDKIPIMAVMGDSHSALFAQGCHTKGMVKATYGTGSSVMMNTGSSPIESSNGLAASMAWCIGGKKEYVLEGNINYAGAIISWLKDTLGIIKSVDEVEELITMANPDDETTMVPAFSGLSAPYWKNDVKASLTFMGRTTGKAEIVKAAVESIAFQIMDVVRAMEKDFGEKVRILRTDGGATDNRYLMQFQSDLIESPVQVSVFNELSAMGVAYLSGVSLGIYNKEEIFNNISYNIYKPESHRKSTHKKICLWKKAVEKLLQD